MAMGLKLTRFLCAKPPERTIKLSLVSAIACLYTTWRLAGLECERVSAHLRHGRFERGLTALERACTLVVIADALVDVVGQQSPGAPLAIVCRRLLAHIEHWLEEARRELPMAASYLCNTAIGADGELRATLRRLICFISQTN